MENRTYRRFRSLFIILISFLLSDPLWADDLSAIDLFNSISYNGSTGTAPWNGTWTEVGESNGTNRGNVRVVDSDFCVAPNCLRLGGNRVNFSRKGIRRAVNLSSATTAVLKFTYRREAINNRGSGSVRVQASKDGSSWTTLDTISFTSSDDSNVLVASYDITNQAAAGSQI
jgi:hypothetical protein